MGNSCQKGSDKSPSAGRQTHYTDQTQPPNNPQGDVTLHGVTAPAAAVGRNPLQPPPPTPPPQRNAAASRAS